jgi:hypothetical protein
MKIDKIIAPASAGILALGVSGCAESTNETVPNVYLPEESCEALGSLAAFMDTPQDNIAEIQAEIGTIHDLSSPEVQGTLAPFGMQHEAARDAANSAEVVVNLIDNGSDTGAADWQLLFNDALGNADGKISDTMSAYCPDSSAS